MTLGFRVQPYGLTPWCDLFTPRQLLTLLTFVKWVRRVYEEMMESGYQGNVSKTIATYRAFTVNRLADWNSSLCSWSPEKTGGAKI